MSKTYISWDEFHKDCDIAAAKALSVNCNVIIGIGRGGVVPARIMAEIIKPKEFYIMGLKLYDDQTKGEKVTIYQNLPDDAVFDRHDRILVVDDISDGGTTLSFAYSRVYVQTGGAQVWTACPYMKTGTTTIPSFYSRELDPDKWVVFPFEKD